jgi:hypothetical protein
MISKFELVVEEIPGGDLTATMMIDGKYFGEDYVDLIELKKSALGSGAYDLQTCGCGEPGCAGFFEPIFVEHLGDIVRWEFDGRYHPIAKNENAPESSVTSYEFDRKQYMTEIQEKFSWLRSHPRRNSIGPYGFDSSIFDAEFPFYSEPQLPFERGAEIIVGYIGDYQQPWVWIENNLDVYPSQLMVNGAMWSRFGCWSSMCGSGSNGLSRCVWSKDDTNFQLENEVKISKCNHGAESLAKDLQNYWGSDVTVLWEKAMETTQLTFVRCQLDTKALSNIKA